MIKKFFSNKKLWIPVVVLLVLVGVFFIYRGINQSKTTASSLYKTAPLTRGSLTATVGATGTIRAKQTALVNWQTTGTVQSVLVNVGDVVAKSTRLAELSQTSLSQQIILAQSDLVTAKRNLDNLEKSSLTTSQAEQTLAVAQKALDDAKDKRESKKFTKADQSVIDTAYANYILSKQAVTDAEPDYLGTKYKAEDDPIRASAISVYSAAKQRMDTALANYNYAKSYPDVLEQAEIDANLALAQSKVNDAQREYDRLKNGADPEDVAAARAKVAATEATLKMAFLETPFAGTVTDVESKVGDQVTPALNGFRVDDLSHLYADIQVTEVDINRIQIGQDATLTFDAIPDKQYKSKVTDVGHVGTAVQGVVNFNVTVEILDADEAVKPGMTAAINIVVNKLDNVLLVQNRSVRLIDGKRNVYILKNNIPSPVVVTIGANSDTTSEVLSGDIKEGDLIILNPPTATVFGPGGGGGGGGGSSSGSTR
ncbi:MAG TPA: efflux RND transporter periplasmic adaptor subunit [Leptolinea sp.]